MAAVILFFLLFTLFVAGIEMARIIKQKKIDYLSWIMLVFILFFGISPALWYRAVETHYTHFWGNYGDFDHEFFLTILIGLVITIFFSIRVGWIIAEHFYRNHKSVQPIRSLSNENTLIKQLSIPAWALLVISVISYYLYTRAYGGFIEIFQYTTAIRGGWIDVPNKWSFLQKFGGLSMFSSFLFYCGVVNKHLPSRTRLHFSFGFFVSFLFAIYVLLTWEGRLSLASFILIFLLAYLTDNQKKISMWKIMGLFIFFGILIFFSRSAISFTKQLFLDSVESNISHPVQMDFFDFYLKEFSFPLVSIFTAFKEVYFENFPERLFVDYPVAFAYLIPKSWIPELPDKISAINTHFIDPAFVGEIPTDIISLGIYNLGILGAPILAIFYGMFARILQHQMTKITPEPLRSILTIAFGLWIAKSIVYHDPVNMLMAIFHLLVGGGVTLIYCKLFPQKRRKYS